MAAQSQANTHASGETIPIATPATAPIGARTGHGERSVPVDQVEVADRLRSASEATVAELMVSIAEVGQVQPIVLRMIDRDDGTVGLRLVVGLHRLEACRRLGRPVRARLMAISELDARQMELDENLVRADLTPLDFARFVADRLEVYAARNPDMVVSDPRAAKTGRGRPPKNFVSLTKTPGMYVKAVMGFADETAQETNLSRRSIYRAVETWAGLQDVAERLQGTPMARNGGLLRQIAATPANLRPKVVDQLVADPAVSVTDALLIAQGRQPAEMTKSKTDEELGALKKLWGKASPSVRAAFLEDLAGRSLPKGWTLVRGDEA